MRGKSQGQGFPLKDSCLRTRWRCSRSLHYQHKQRYPFMRFGCWFVRNEVHWVIFFFIFFIFFMFFLFLLFIYFWICEHFSSCSCSSISFCISQLFSSAQSATSPSWSLSWNYFCFEEVPWKSGVGDSGSKENWEGTIGGSHIAGMRAVSETECSWCADFDWLFDEVSSNNVSLDVVRIGRVWSWSSICFTSTWSTESSTNLSDRYFSKFSDRVFKEQFTAWWSWKSTL